MIGKRFQSVKLLTIYTVINYDSNTDQYECEYRIVTSMRIQRVFIDKDKLFNQQLFKEI